MTLPATAFPLSVSGARILGADGNPVRLAGVNWGGAQQDGLLPYGLDKLPRNQIIDRIISWGFNHVRFPFALGTFVTSNGTLKTGLADEARLSANGDLQGLTPWGVYQVLADDMTAAGLYVIAVCHQLHEGWCCSTVDKQGLWYNDTWPSSTFSDTWFVIADRFKGNPMIGYDLKNEPRAATVGGVTLTPTWGDGVWGTDFQRMYSWHASQIRAIDPDCLIFCEGLNYAGDLARAGAQPVTGANIVYSMHDYSWYHGAGQSQASYVAQMDANGGYLVTQGKAPLWIGEVGTSTDVSTAALGTGWFPQFLDWAAARDVHFCWWELAATSVLGTEPATNVVKVQPGQRESFGLMSGQDWLGSQEDVLAMLTPLML